MGQAINLIPTQEKVQQNKTKLVKMSTVVAIFIVVIVGIVSAVLFYQVTTLKKEISDYETAIARYRDDIKGMTAIEVSARNLDSKYSALKDLLDMRTYYSVLFDETMRRKPDSVDIETFSVNSDGKITLSGEGTDYIAIADFVKALSDLNYAGAGEGLAAVFTDVTLNNVNLDAQTSRANYFIGVTVNESLLKR
jgi:Tfp pilus assembly protein PilN